MYRETISPGTCWASDSTQADDLRAVNNKINRKKPTLNRTRQKSLLEDKPLFLLQKPF